MNNSSKPELRRPSGRSGTDHSRSQSKSNRGSTGRPSNVQSINYGADEYDGDESMNRGLRLLF